MARNVHNAKKRRLLAAGKQTKWAPYWVIPRLFGLGRRVHPSRASSTKRHWRRTRTKV